MIRKSRGAAPLGIAIGLVLGGLGIAVLVRSCGDPPPPEPVPEPPPPVMGSLLVSAKPWADAYIDGNREGKIDKPFKKILAVGSHRVELVYPGPPRQDKVCEVEISEHQLASCEAVFDRKSPDPGPPPKPTGAVVMAASPWADVYVNGTPKGRVERAPKEERLPVGSHEIQLVYPGPPRQEKRCPVIVVEEESRRCEAVFDDRDDDRDDNVPDDCVLSGTRPTWMQGVEACSQQRWDCAVRWLQRVRVADLEPEEQLAVYWCRGVALIERGRYDEAEEDLLDVLRIDPGARSDLYLSPDAIRAFGQARARRAQEIVDDAIGDYQAGRCQAALEALEQASRLDRNNAALRTYLRLAEACLERPPPPPPCTPSRVRHTLTVRKGSYIEGIEWTDQLRLPVDANRVTLAFDDDAFERDECWKVYLYGLGNSVVHEFSGSGPRTTPAGPRVGRGRTLEQVLPGIREVRRVVVHAGGCTPDAEARRPRDRRVESIPFELTLEVACPASR